MPPLPSPETREFLNALEGFLENPPRDLPEGAMDTMNQLHSSLKGYTGPGELSPGEQEAMKAGKGVEKLQGSDIAVPYDKAALGADQPSPGQKEFQQAVGQFADALASHASSSSS